MTTNEELFTSAKRHIPGGVNSPVRAFAGVAERLFLSVVPKAQKCTIQMVEHILIMWGHGVQ